MTEPFLLDRAGKRMNMAVRRGPEGFQKRQRELQKRKKAEEKLARKRERKEAKRATPEGEGAPGSMPESGEEPTVDGDDAGPETS
jgi:ATP-dependent Clp protease ATP-binding subunit ClpA